MLPAGKLVEGLKARAKLAEGEEAGADGGGRAGRCGFLGSHLDFTGERSLLKFIIPLSEKNRNVAHGGGREHRPGEGRPP